MDIIQDARSQSAWSQARRLQGERIGLVPTMGFLHEGHLSLMRLLRPKVDCLIVSIYVNPLQFGPNEDLEMYPTDVEGDANLCKQVGVDGLFRPTQLYPDGFCTSVSVHGLTDGLCGAARPGHFEGVATVVARLFGVTQCDVAAFGEKDYQQLCVLRRMARDLALSVEVIGGPIVRDSDGLALSSRNMYLSVEDRRRALTLSGALRSIQDLLMAGETSAAVLIERGLGMLQVDGVDYLQIVDAVSLKPVQYVTKPSRVLVAALVGRSRLLDNLALEP